MVNELFSARTSMSFSSRSGRSAFITNSFSVSYMSTGGAQVARSACPERSRVALSSNKRMRSEEHTSELQSRGHLVCRLLPEKKKQREAGLTGQQISNLIRHADVK